MEELTDLIILELTCLVEAPRTEVFELLTVPGELAKWWGPRGFEVPEVQIDLRVGGLYRMTMRPPAGEAFHLTGEFLEVERPTTLGYTFRWEEPHPDDRETSVRLALHPLDETTQVFLTQGAFATEERRALHRDGWSESFEKLRALAARP